MKQILFFVAVVASFGAQSALSQQQNVVSIDFGIQQIDFSSQSAKIDQKTLPWLRSRSKSGETFGVFFQAIKGTSSVIELLGANSKILKSITVNDLLGKTTSNGVKLLSSKYSPSGNRSEDEYEVATPQGKMVLVLNSTATGLKSERSNPARLFVKIAVKNFKGTLSGAVISLPVQGNIETNANGAVISGIKSGNALSIIVAPVPSKISNDKKSFSVTVKPILGSDENVLALLTVQGEESKAAAMNAVVMSSAGTANDVSIVTSASKIAAQPADTVEYEIICMNTGKGPVSDITISNPIPDGTKYLDGSAAGEGTLITFERIPAVAPKIGEVTSVQWKLTKALNIGEEKIVRYKIIVQ